jgi:predicted HTH transcriptional regulator
LEILHRITEITPPGKDADTATLIEEEDKKPATVAGLLLFCANPNQFLPQAGIDAVAYPGKEKNYATKERLSIT